MTDDGRAISVNSVVREVLHLLSLVVAPDFSKCLSRELVERIQRGDSVDSAIDASLGVCHLGFASRPERESFKNELRNRLASQKFGPVSLLDILLEFKKYAERVLVHGFKTNSNEEFCRSNLQTYLEKTGRTTREAVSGGGLIDVLVASGEPVEAKLWKGNEYFNAGVEELQEYMRAEGQAVGYYVVFDGLRDNEALESQRTIRVPEARIYQIAVRINPGPPSKRRQKRLSQELAARDADLTC